MAGRNAGGALIVHTDDAVTYTGTADYCATNFLPASCEAAITRTDKDENTPAVIWLLAAFPDTSSPAATAIQFGIEHNLPANEGYFERYAMCATLEMPDQGWPETGFGNLLSFGSTPKTDHLFPFYWFAAYGFEGAHLGTRTYPSTDEAKFVDDGSPPGEDPITSFGTLRWGADGANNCPAGIHGDDSQDNAPENGGSEGGTQNGIETGEDTTAPFEQDLPLGPHILWIEGEELQGTYLHLRFDGDTLFSGSDALAPLRSSDKLLSGGRLDSLYAAVPSYSALRHQGVPPAAAADSFVTTLERAKELAASAYQDALGRGAAQAADTAIAVFEASGLIEVRPSPFAPVVNARDNRIVVTVRGIAGRGSFILAPHTRSVRHRGDAALGLHRLLTEALSDTVPCLIVLGSGAMTLFSGGNRAMAEQQLRYIAANGTTTGLPEGPLRSTDPIVAQVLSRRGR